MESPPADDHRTAALFARAMTLEAAARTAFLEELEGRDPGGARRLRSLLAQHAAADRSGFLPLGERLGSEIGPYRLVEVLGAGGMGIVYRAEQHEPVRRDVALKLVRAGMDSRRVVDRFDAERQALAMMDHTNVARVLDAGATADGRPYFVMELVRGVPITQYCDGRRLPVAPRLDLFIDVCAAVQHAHQKGIVHRDLKPSNVLVTTEDGAAVPKVIDFGVAKAIGDGEGSADLTLTGQIVGTPRYMSPEQAEGRAVDTRTDVYALGTMLYELLAGVTPLDLDGAAARGVTEALRALREVDPPRPSTRVERLEPAAREAIAGTRSDRPELVARRLRGDLDWIVMRAIEKDPARRYPAVGDLARDLARFLADEPVSARPPTSGYLARKFVRRHRSAVAGAAAVMTVMIAGTAVAWTLAVKESRARARADLEAENARMVAAVLTRMFTGRDEAERLWLRRLSPVELLGLAEREASANLAQHPGSRTAVVEAIARGYLGLGYLNEAERLIDACRRARSSAAIADDEARVRSDLLLGLVRVRQERPSEARAILEPALAIASRRWGRDHDAALDAMEMLGDVAILSGDFAELERSRGEIVAVARDRFGREDGRTLAAERRWSEALSAVGRSADAITLLEETVATYERTRGLDDRDALGARSDLAVLYDIDGRTKEASAIFREVLARQEATLGAEHPDTLRSMNYVQSVLWDQGNRAEAIALHERELSLRRSHHGEREELTLICLGDLATRYELAGRLADALALREELLAARTGIGGAAAASTLWAAHDRAALLLELDQPEEAAAALTAIIRDAMRAEAILPQDLLAFRATLSIAMCRTGDARAADAAAPILGAMIEENEYGRDHHRTKALAAAMAASYEAQGRSADAAAVRARVAAR
jgi:serine/threonine protein kinase